MQAVDEYGSVDEAEGELSDNEHDERGPERLTVVPEAAAREFGVLDRNNDAKVDDEELQAALGQIAGIDPSLIPEIARAIFERADADGDGKLDIHEFLDLAEVGEAASRDSGDRDAGCGWGWCDCSWCCELRCFARLMSAACCCCCSARGRDDRGRRRRHAAKTRSEEQ